MPAGPLPDIGLGDGPHLDGRLDPDLHVPLLQTIRHRQGVDGGGQHTHMVRPDPLHPVAAVLHAPPEVAAAYHDGHLYPGLGARLHHVAHLADHIKIQTAPAVSSQHLAADLQQHPFKLGFSHDAFSFVTPSRGGLLLSAPILP